MEQTIENWSGCLVKVKPQWVEKWELEIGVRDFIYIVLEDGGQWVDVRLLPQYDKYNLRGIHRWEKESMEIIDKDFLKR